MRRIQTREKDFNNEAERFLNVIKFESNLNFSISHLFSVRYKPY